MQESLFFLAEQMVFCLFIPLGLSLIVQAKLWAKLTKFVYSQSKETFNFIMLVSGSVCLPFGLFLVLTHNDWNLSPSVIVTVVGWITVVKCLVLLLWPQLAIKSKILYGRKESVLKWFLRISGVIYIILGLLVLSNFWAV